MKKIFFTLSLLLTGLIIQAQNISPVVIAMPDDMLMGITLDQRKLLIVPENDTAEVAAISVLGDTIKRVGFSDDFISIQTSEAGNLQVKLLSLVNNSQIIAVITTVCGTACDSKIDFYTTEWAPLAQTDLFPHISKDDFIKEGIDRNSETFVNAYAALDMTPIKLNFSEKDKNITAVYDIKNYLSKDDYEKILPFLKDSPVIYKWDKFAYK